MAQESLSEYAKFHLALDGFDVYLHGSLMYRWQLFAAKVNVDDLLNERLPGFEVKPKEDIYSAAI